MPCGKIDFADVFTDIVADIAASRTQSWESNSRAASKSSPSLQRTIAPPEFIPFDALDVTPRSNRSVPRQRNQMYRHGIEYLIGKYQPIELRRQMFQPDNPRREMRRKSFK